MVVGVLQRRLLAIEDVAAPERRHHRSERRLADLAAESVTVCGVNESLKREWASVTILDGKGIDAVIAPIARSRKLRNGHQFDRSHSEIGQLP